MVRCLRERKRASSEAAESKRDKKLQVASDRFPLAAVVGDRDIIPWKQWNVIHIA
jgi:hypothetical protein